MHIIIHTKDDDENLPGYRNTVNEAMKTLNMLPSWNEVYFAGDTNEVAKLTIDNTEAWNGNNKQEFSVEYLVNKMQRHLNPGKKLKLARIFQKTFSFLLALFIAFCPKCPICWAAWLSGLGLISANTITYRPRYLYVSMVLIVLNIIALYLLNKKYNLKPLLINMAGALLITINRFTLNTSFLMVAGGILLIVGTAWSSLPSWMKRSGFRTNVANSTT